MWTFKKGYFLLFLLLFLVEIGIARFFHDHVIRPYVGDLLVVILIYSLVKTFWNKDYRIVALYTLIFAFLIEISQAFHLVRILRLQHSHLANLVLGNTFQWVDLLAYAAGILIVISIEKRRKTIH